METSLSLYSSSSFACAVALAGGAWVAYYRFRDEMCDSGVFWWMPWCDDDDDDNDSGGGPGALARGGSGFRDANGSLGSFLDTIGNKKGPWFVISGGNYPGRAVPGKIGGGDSVRIIYFANKYGSRDSGFSFKANPRSLLPATEARLYYEIFLPDSWQWGGSSKGGKLPGFCLGTSGNECATGGDFQRQRGSVRLMWGNGVAIVYVYPTGQSADAAWSGQGTNYVSKANRGGKNDQAGHGLFSFTLEKGKWNSIDLYVRLNTPGMSDGTISLSVNGQSTQTVDDVRLRHESVTKITSLHFSTFFGGSNVGWAPSKDVWAEFRNFQLTASR